MRGSPISLLHRCNVFSPILNIHNIPCIQISSASFARFYMPQIGIHVYAISMHVSLQPCSRPIKKNQPAWEQNQYDCHVHVGYCTIKSNEIMLASRAHWLRGCTRGCLERLEKQLENNLKTVSHVILKPMVCGHSLYKYSHAVFFANVST